MASPLTLGRYAWAARREAPEERENDAAGRRPPWAGPRRM